ncbi:GTP-binding family protein [Artemisia annua]|uniref:GTP-binding family protein n=1 Tax=Artemisia annua TaxID=35608 RepID=A0A2U1LZB2_ARTAN|nr:GTP-binding family protein [Artemisia annua]
MVLKMQNNLNQQPSSRPLSSLFQTETAQIQDASFLNAVVKQKQACLEHLTHMATVKGIGRLVYDKGSMKFGRLPNFVAYEVNIKRTARGLLPWPERSGIVGYPNVGRSSLKDIIRFRNRVTRYSRLSSWFWQFLYSFQNDTGCSSINVDTPDSETFSAVVGGHKYMADFYISDFQSRVNVERPKKEILVTNMMELMSSQISLEISLTTRSSISIDAFTDKFSADVGSPNVPTSRDCKSRLSHLATQWISVFLDFGAPGCLQMLTIIFGNHQRSQTKPGSKLEMGELIVLLGSSCFRSLPKKDLNGYVGRDLQDAGITKKTSMQNGFSPLYYSIDSTAKLKEEINTVSKHELELLKMMSN